MKEVRVWGPPGTGKTTWIADSAARSVESFGPDQVSICSLTNAAVREVASRDIPIDLDNLSTLHARCKRALHAPPPAEAFMKEFRDDYPNFADDRHIPIKRSRSREDSMLSSGPTIYDEVQIARQRLIPFNMWGEELKAWYSVWYKWCSEKGLMDYSSWLENTAELGCLPPQAAVYVDEAQDHTPLQLKVLRSWNTRYLVLVGDDDQSLYEWSGSVAEEFLKSDAEVEVVLPQSFRVPRRIHKLAEDITSRIIHRKAKKYMPTDEEGLIIPSDFTLALSMEKVIDDVDDGQERMILTTCGHMLRGIISHLELEGIPFHNPYRKSDMDWNPLSTDLALAIRSYLIDRWTGSSILTWMGIMDKSIFSSEEGLENLCMDSLDMDIPYDKILPFLCERTASTVLSRQAEALLRFGRRSIRGAWEYYAKVFREEPDPKVIVGTIHSVKGGESDVVHVFPDLSVASYMDTLHNPDRIHRLFYVAITRAKKSLVLHDTANKYAYLMGRSYIE